MNTSMLKTVVRWCGYGLLLVPLAYVPWLLFPLTFSKVVLGQALLICSIVAAIGVWMFEPETRPRWNMFWGVMLVFCAVQVLAAIFSVNPHHSFWSDISRGSGVLMTLGMVGLMAVYSSGIIRREDWKRYGWFALGVSGVVIVIALIQRYVPDIVPNFAVGRVASTLGNPIFFGGYCLLVALLLGVFWEKVSVKWGKVLLVLFAIATLVAFVWARSRGAMLGFLVMAAGMSAFGLYGGLERFQKYIRGLVIVGVIGLAVLVGFRNHPAIVSSPINAWTSSATLQTRFVNWGMAIDGALDKPVLGWGPENYREVVAAHFDNDLSMLSFTETFVDKPHNFFLEVAVTSGFLGFLVYLLLWSAVGMMVYRLYRQDKMTRFEMVLWFSVGAGYAVHLAFLFETISTLFLHSFLVAWLLWRSGEEKEPAGKPAAKGVGVVVLLVLVVAGVWGMHRSVIAPAISAYKTNLGIQYMYINDWVSARDHFFAAYDYKTPYHFERWRKPAEASARFVFVDSPNRSVTDIPLSWRSIWIEDREKIAVLGEELFAGNSNYNNAVFLGKWYYQTSVGLDDAEGLQRAEELFLHAHELSPNREEPLLLLAQKAVHLQDSELAVKYTQQAVELSPKFTIPHWFYGTALLVDNKPTQAVDELNTAIDLGYRPLLEQYDTAVTQLQTLEAFDDIVRLYEKIVSVAEPKNIEMRRRLAVAYSLVGEVEKAKETAYSILEIDPTLFVDVEAFVSSLE